MSLNTSQQSISSLLYSLIYISIILGHCYTFVGEVGVAKLVETN